jgi:hypothetical protein
MRRRRGGGIRMSFVSEKGEVHASCPACRLYFCKRSCLLKGEDAGRVLQLGSGSALTHSRSAVEP